MPRFLALAASVALLIAGCGGEGSTGPATVARIVVLTPDTTLFAGASYTINAYASDSNGNRLRDALSFTAGENVASVDRSGRVTVGGTIGRGSVVIRAGGVMDSARFTVVPSGTMAFVDASSTPTTIATAKLDGSNRKRWVEGTMPAYPSISADGSLIAYQQSSTGVEAQIYVIDATGTKRQLTSPATMFWAWLPHFSGDGAWVFFAGLGDGDFMPSIWRVRTDGTSLTRVVNLDNGFYNINFGVAPDGSRIVYSDNFRVTALELATGAKVSLGAYATFVEFSPDGKRVAYLGDGYVNIVNVDGTSPIKVAASQANQDAGLAWTPDGAWLLVRGLYGPLLVNSTTGEVISLPFVNYYQFSAIR